MSILGDTLNAGLSATVELESDGLIVIEQAPSIAGAWAAVTGGLWHEDTVSKERDDSTYRDDVQSAARLVVPSGSDLSAGSEYLRVDGVIYSIDSRDGDTVKTYYCSRADYSSAGADRGISR